MHFGVRTFKGMRPARSADLLSAGEAQNSTNTKLTGGDLKPLLGLATVATLSGAGPYLSIYRFGQAAVSDHVTIGDNTVVMGKTGVISDLGPNQIVFGHLARPRAQAMRIEALLSNLPEMHSAIRKIKKHLGL